MKIAVGADHGGYPLNVRIVAELRAVGHAVEDFGTRDGARGDDYPDYARRVGEAVREGGAEVGIVVCGSGVGASVAARSATSDASPKSSTSSGRRPPKPTMKYE
ncbi:MAG: RpiB/LacA/LacB family sugar-phosphate isomerase [Acidobacteria bacterium]|nr:RpiB/LacA/LacB family sugar-phosphate isomerase [Acidobacteriota bacterium]